LVNLSTYWIVDTLLIVIEDKYKSDR
jgi:hypothetical protein